MAYPANTIILERFISGSSGSTTTYECSEVTPPEMIQNVITYATNLTNGFERTIPGNLKSWGEVSAKVVFSSGSNLSTFKATVTSGSAWYKLTFPDASTATFDAVSTTVTPITIAYMGTDVYGAEIKLKPAGDITIA